MYSRKEKTRGRGKNGVSVRRGGRRSHCRYKHLQVCAAGEVPRICTGQSAANKSDDLWPGLLDLDSDDMWCAQYIDSISGRYPLAFMPT